MCAMHVSMHINSDWLKCVVSIIVFMDHLHDLIRQYEIGGHFAELVNLLEQGINLDRAHQGIYTQLGILYAKYKEIKLMEHINLFWSRLNIPTLLQACKDNLHWKETVFLYTHYDAFDQIALAQQLQKHELLEFRRIAAHLYRTNKRWTTSITLSKQDGLWQDAMETAALSADKTLAEELLRFFVENIKKESCPKSCFAACLFTCFELIRPDVVLELAWRYDLQPYCMPFMVQTFRTYSEKLDLLYTKIEYQEKKIEEDEKKENEAKTAAIDAQAKHFVGSNLPMLTGPGMVGMNQPNAYAPQNQGFGAPQNPQMFGAPNTQPTQQFGTGYFG